MSDILDKIHVSIRNALIVAILLVLSYIAISILLEGNKELLADVTNIHTIISDLFATLCLFYGAYNSRYYKKMYIAWIILALSRLSFTIGDISWYIIETVMHQSPFPSIADVGFLGFYPLFALGILILPKEPLSSSEKLKVLLDTGIIMIASATIFWIQLIAPTIASNAQADVVTSTLTVAYPVADLVLLFGLIELLFRRIKSVSLHPILLLIACMCFMILTDFVFLDQSLKGTYVSGGLLDTGWIVAYSLMGMAGVVQANSRKLDLSYISTEPQTVQFTWPFYIPSICIGIMYLLLIWDYDHPLPIGFYSLSWALGGIISLFVIRQVVALNENVRLYQAKVKENTQRKNAEEEIRKLNNELEDRVADRTARLESANEELIIEVQERKNAEEARRESQQLMSSIIGFLPDAIMAIDLKSNVIIWNKAMEALTGVNAGEILGKGEYEYALPFYGIRRPILVDMILNPHKDFEREYMNFEREGSVISGETFIPTFRKKGSYLLAKATALYDPAGRLVGAIESVRDMTERRLMEQTLERTRTELHIAAEIQKSFIPETTPLIQNLEIAAKSIPAMEVGGDFYDFISLPDGKYGLVIADVAGKSIPAALFMALSRTIVRANVAHQSKTSEVLKNANLMIAADATAGMFVTLLYGILDGKTLTIKYANAGHPPPLLFRSETSRFEADEVTGIALGAIDNIEYEDRIIRLFDGDIAVFYTDGVTEAMNIGGELYGLRRLTDIINESRKLSSIKLVDEVLKDISEFSAGTEQSDDITLIVLKVCKNSQNNFEIMISAKREEMPKVISFVNDIMSGAGFGRKDVLGIELAVEEAIINIINHGYRGDEGTILVKCNLEVDRLTVTIEDQANRFDPTQFDEPNLVEDLDKRPIGGLGIYLIRSLTDALRYEYEDGKNRLILLKKKSLDRL